MLDLKSQPKHKRFILKSIGIHEEDKVKLGQDLLRINIHREKILAHILILINTILFVLDILTFKGLGWEEPIFIPFSNVHSLLIAVSIAFLILNRVKEKYGIKKAILSRIAHLLINFLVVSLCSVIGTYNIMVHQQPFAYVIAMFCIASLVYLSGYERFLIFIVPLFIYVIRGIAIINNINYLIEVIFFCSLLTGIALLVSKINYKAYLKIFVNNKMIQQKNEELDNLYKTTEHTLIKRTNELNEVKEYEELRTAFFANISHELRTPLNVIFSAEQMLRLNLKGINNDENQRKNDQYMHIMRQNCYRLLRLIDNFIDITKIDAGYFQTNLKNWDIVKVIENICLSVAAYIEYMNMTLIFDTDVEEKVIACDLDKIERIILNLLSNAVKFTPGGKTIYVTIYQKLNKVIISVKDTGIGIPVKMQDLIFEKFIQVDKSSTRSREGSGIGLSIVKSLVEMHNGTIAVISEEGKGSEFIIEIPDKVISENNWIEENQVSEENQIVDKVKIEFSDIYC